MGARANCITLTRSYEMQAPNTSVRKLSIVRTPPAGSETAPSPTRQPETTPVQMRSRTSVRLVTERGCTLPGP
jgi:hypothetical protein